MNCDKLPHRTVLVAMAVLVTFAVGSVPQMSMRGELQAAELVRLTKDGRLKRDPVFVPDRNEVVFVVQERPVQLRLMRLRLNDLQVEPLHENETRTEFEPAYSSTGRYLAFVQSQGNLSLGLVIRDLKSNDDAHIKPEGGFSGMRSPSFSPDEQRVLFCKPTAKGQHVFSVNTAAQDRKQLTEGAGLHNWAVYSPDGSRIVYASTRDGDYELYSMNPDGTNSQRLTTSPRQDIRPAVSPDGQRIAFTSNRDGNYEIYIMNIDGRAVTRVTNHAERDDYAVWHPDGERLIFVAERAGRHDLYMLDVP